MNEYSIFVDMFIKDISYLFSAWKKITLLLVGILVVQITSAQIIGGEIEDKKEEKKKKEKVNRDTLTGTTFYITYLHNYSYRYFEDHSAYSAYEKWNDQKADYGKGISGGVFLPIAGNFSLDIGVTFFGSKVKYNYVDPNSDSTYNYTQSYTQLGMPLKLRYTYGNKFQVFGFAGVTPLNILNVRYKADYKTINGTPVDVALVKDKEKLAIFNLMATAGVGFTFNMDWIGITIYPEYRQHLFNAYSSQKPITYRMYGFGLNAGLTLRF